MKTNEMAIEGFKFYYSISKNDQNNISPLIFINGAFQDMHSWHYMNKYFSQLTSTIVLDLPGWGKADHLPGDIDFSLYARAINDVLIKEGIKHVNVVSTSYGTPIAVQFAKNFRASVDNLILTSPLMEIQPSLLNRYSTLNDLVRRKDLSNLSAFLFDIGLMNTEEGVKGKVKQYDLISSLFNKQILKLSDDKLKKFKSNTDRIIKFGTASIEGIQDLKTLIFTGEYDSFTTCKRRKSLADTFTNARFDKVPETDHLFLFENPKFAIQLIADFLTKAQDYKNVSQLTSAIRA